MITAEKILENRNVIHEYINKYISSPRKEKLLEFYLKFDERLTMMPASHKSEYHNCFEGGYLDHVRRVVECALKINQVWVDMGVNDSTYTIEELVFSALNHDLGKIGDEKFESYIPQTDEWRRNKLNETYQFNTNLPFASVPDRGLFLLQQHDVKYTFNEMLTIQTHDGLYDDANKKYLMGFSSEQKPRTSLPFIVHQADLMAARIEWERENLEKLLEPKSKNDSVTSPSKSSKPKPQEKALGSIKSQGLNNLLKNI